MSQYLLVRLISRVLTASQEEHLQHMGLMKALIPSRDKTICGRELTNSAGDFIKLIHNTSIKIFFSTAKIIGQFYVTSYNGEYCSL